MKFSLLPLIALAGAIWCGGCVTAPDNVAIEAAYKISTGPIPVITEYRTKLDFQELDKSLGMRVVFPASPGRYPLIIFSHGNGCLQDMYAGFADHWASWGYVVIQPVHMDSRELGFSMKGVTMEIMNQVVSSRRSDVRFILESLDQLEQQVPGLAGQIDHDRLVMAGHSMGAGTAMMLTGVSLIDPRDQSVLGSDEDRFDALILISEPSNNRLVPDEPWQLTTVPTFIATGSEDFSTTGARNGKKSRNAYQLPADAERPDQPRYYLYMDGSDHYLGGLICRDSAPGPRDFEALQIINGSSVAFLDAFMGNDAAARKFLDSGMITELTSGRASLELR